MRGFFTPTRERPRAGELALRLVSATAMVLVALNAFQRPVEKWLIPVNLIAREIPLLAPAFSVESSMIIDGAGENAYRAHINASQPVRIDDHILLPPTAWEVLIPLDAIVRYCAVTLAVALAWPATGPRELALRCLLSLPLVQLQPLVAIPSLILSELWGEVRAVMDIHGISAWKVWSGALFDGGGFVLACVLAAVAIVMARPAPDNDVVA